MELVGFWEVLVYEMSENSAYVCLHAFVEWGVEPNNLSFPCSCSWVIDWLVD